MKESKYSTAKRGQQGEGNKSYKFKLGKEGNINSELVQEKNSDINNRDVCLLCNRPAKTGVECGICSR